MPAWSPTFSWPIVIKNKNLVVCCSIHINIHPPVWMMVVVELALKTFAKESHIYPAIIAKIPSLIETIRSNLCVHAQFEPVSAIRSVGTLANLRIIGPRDSAKAIPVDLVCIGSTMVVCILDTDNWHARFINDLLPIKDDITNCNTSSILDFPIKTPRPPNGVPRVRLR